MRGSIRARMGPVNGTLRHESIPRRRLLDFVVPRRSRAGAGRLGAARSRLAVVPWNLRPRSGRGLPGAPALERGFRRERALDDADSRPRPLEPRGLAQPRLRDHCDRGQAEPGAEGRPLRRHRAGPGRHGALLEGLLPGVHRVVLDRLDVAVEADLQLRVRPGPDRSGHADEVAPDHGARVAEAGNRRRPADVLAGIRVPAQGRRVALGHSAGGDSAEGRPIDARPRRLGYGERGSGEAQRRAADCGAGWNHARVYSRLPRMFRVSRFLFFIVTPLAVSTVWTLRASDPGTGPPRPVFT